MIKYDESIKAIMATKWNCRYELIDHIQSKVNKVIFIALFLASDIYKLENNIVVN